jgi:uncharacterized repeat protein (TIGR01451 family)
MSVRSSCLALLTAALVLAVPSAASADTTFGTVMPPAGSTATACPDGALGELLLDSDGPALDPTYTVPGGAGPQVVTHWQLNVDGAAAGAQATFAVVRINFSAASFTIVGADTETLHAGTLPSGNVEDFTIANPIAVEPGDTIGLYLPGTTNPGITCDWTGGLVPSVAGVGGFADSPPFAGQVLTPTGIGSFTASQADLNLGATFAPASYDAGLSLSAGPSNAIAGQPAVLTATVTNHGPYAGPITFTDPVPNGLTIVAASADNGSCTTTTPLNIVTCTFPNVLSGQSAKAAIVVKPAAAQTYTDQAAVTVAPGATDPVAANNSATTTLQVTVPVTGPTKCVVPKLGRTSVGLSKKLLGLLGCKVGKTQKLHSGSVAKGLVIKTAPGPGTYAAAKTIVLDVSSGPAKKPHKHTHTTKSGRR